MFAFVQNIILGYMRSAFGLTASSGGRTTMAAGVTFGATTASLASFNIPAGTAPSVPADGDVWREDNTNTGLKIRINGVTKTVTVG